MKKQTALSYIAKIKAIYPSLKFWTDKSSTGFSVNLSMQDGSYSERLRDEESCQDYLRIHTA